MKGTAANAAADRPTILVVEDDTKTRTMITELLEAYHFRVLAAPDGEAALRMARAHRPDAICLDLGLPGMDGIEAAAALQADPDTRDLPIVAVTGRDVPREGAEAIARDFVAYVPKPIGPQQFVALLHCILGGRRAPQDATLPVR